jgi:hypothetical protein
VTRKKRQSRLVALPSRHSQGAPKLRRKPLQHLPEGRCITRQAAFLAAYHKTSSIAAAAKAAGIKPAQHYRWLAASAAYWEAFRELQEDVTRRLQDKVVELAMEGWAELVYYRGRVCGTIEHHSDRLLIFFLEAAKPEWQPYRNQRLAGVEASPVAGTASAMRNG